MGDGNAILRTTDGGATWAPHVVTTEHLGSVRFTDTNTGTVVGDNGTILRTRDGGATWTPQTSGTATRLYDVFFADADTGTVVGYINGTILRTTDGGATWTPRSSTPFCCTAVWFTDANTGTLVDQTTILRTTDGGATWIRELVTDPDHSLRGVFLTNPDTGTVVGDGGTILRMTSGDHRASRRTEAR